MRNDILDAVMGMCAAEAGTEDAMHTTITDSTLKKTVSLIELFSEYNGSIDALKDELLQRNYRSSRGDEKSRSLIQLMPLLFQLRFEYGEDFISKNEAHNMIYRVSEMMLGPGSSRITAGIYLSVASKLIGKRSPRLEVEEGIQEAMQYYRNHPDFTLECRFFEHFCDNSFQFLKRFEVMTTDAEVSILEAALWCIRNTDNFSDCIHLAAALSENSGLLSAVTGSLAGLCYGFENIPTDWISQVAEKEFIHDLCSRANEIYMKEKIQKLDQVLDKMKTADNRKLAQMFSRVVSDSDLICYDYFEVLKSYGIQGKETLTRIIEAANLESVLAILTSLIRKDRFRKCFLETSLEAGIPQLVVSRLKTLVVC